MAQCLSKYAPVGSWRNMKYTLMCLHRRCTSDAMVTTVDIKNAQL